MKIILSFNFVFYLYLIYYNYSIFYYFAAWVRLFSKKAAFLLKPYLFKLTY